jgi:hypothetical protein
MALDRLRNGLVMGERHSRFSATEADRFLREITRSANPHDPFARRGNRHDFRPPSSADRMRRRVSRTGVRDRVPPATLDATPAEAAREEGVAVPGDAARRWAVPASYG